MVTLHEVITFLVSMQISISSLQTHNVNRCGRSRHLARKLSLRRKRSSPNVFEMAATETITRSEERFSRNAETDLVCRLLLEKKKLINSSGHLYIDTRVSTIRRFTKNPLKKLRSFFFKDPATTVIYTLSLHDALPIYVVEVVIWRESSVSGGSGAVQMFLRWQQRKP